MSVSWKGTRVITNGFDTAEFNGPPSQTPCFSITYAGQLYAGKRDPARFKTSYGNWPMREPYTRAVQNPLHGSCKELAEQAIARYGVGDFASYEGIVPHAEAIRRERESTVLLLLGCSNEEDRGVYTGKLFEISWGATTDTRNS